MSDKTYNLALVLGARVSSSLPAAFRKGEKSLDAYQNAAREANRAQETLDRVMSQRKSTLAAEQAFARAKDAVRALGAQMKAAQAPSRELQAQYAAAQRTVTAASAALERQRSALAQVHASTGTANVSLRELTQRHLQLEAAASKAAAAQRRLASAQSMIAAGGNMKGAGTAKFTSGFIQMSMLRQAASAALGPSLEIGMGFEKTMSKVGAISRASAEDLAKLTAQARELGATTTWSAAQAAEGMTYLSMAGFKTNDVLAAMPGMLSLATAGGVELGQAADIASNILSGFGMEASRMGEVGDVLVNTFTQSNTDLNMLGQTMKYVAPVASSLGVSIETVAAMTGKLGDVGIQASQAGTSLRAILNRLVSPTAAKSLDSLGVKVVDANGALRYMPDILAEISAKTRDMTDDMRMATLQQIFGTEAASAAIELMKRASSGELQEFEQRLREQGSAQRTAGQQANNLAGDLAGLNSAYEEVCLVIYDTLSPMLRIATQDMTKTVQAIGKWLDANPGLVYSIMEIGKWVGIAVGALAGLNMLLGAGMWLFGGIVKAVGLAQYAFIALSAAIKGVGVALLFLTKHPIVALMTVIIAAVIALAVAIYENWGPIREFVTGIWASIKEYVGGVIAWLTDGVKSMLGVVTGAVDAIRGAFDTVKGWLPDSLTVGVQAANVPAMASGGIVDKPTLAMIGEAGPEAVIPLSQAHGLGGGGGMGGTMNVQFSPVINVTASGGQGDVQAQVQAAMAQAQLDFRRELERYEADRARLGYR